MNGKIEFVSNYSDLSTDKGFQFEFNCDRCSNGFRTQFRPWAVGSVSSVLDAAGSLLGGVFNTAADVGERVRSAGWQKAHDEAFQEAVQEIRPSFIQCPRCSTWVCRKACWNSKRGLCKECAPDLGVEMSAAQASRSVEEVWAHAKMAEEDKKLAEGNWRETIVASCPNCGAPQATNAKFCPECGTKIKTSETCSKCGAKLTAGAKFCPECGEKVG
jgi:membrane protease subunit (stomatin/prohibitin family)